MATCISSHTSTGGSVCTVPLCEACTGQGQCRNSVPKTTALCEQGVCCRDGGSICGTTDECCNGLACAGGKCTIKQGAQHTPCSGSGVTHCQPLGGGCRFSSDCCQNNSCQAGLCSPQQSVHQLLSYVHADPGLTSGATPDLTYTFTPQDGIPLAMGGSDISKGGLEAVYVATRSPSTGDPGKLLAIDISDPVAGPRVGFSLPLTFTPTAFDLVRTDSSGGNPQDLDVVFGHDGGATFCHVDVSGNTPYQVDSFNCKTVSFKGTAVAVRSRFPHDGFVSVVTTNSELHSVNFALPVPAITATSSLGGLPTGLVDDPAFAWVTIGSFVQKFDHLGGLPNQTMDLGGPALAIAAVGVAVPSPQASPVSELAVATQGTLSPPTTSVFAFEDGNLPGSPKLALSAASGIPVAMAVRSFQGNPFAYVAVEGTAPFVGAVNISTTQFTKFGLPAGLQPIDLIIAGGNADPAAGGGFEEDPDPLKRPDDCSSKPAMAGSCQPGAGFLHVLVRQ
jgi:hypothetical protein